MDIKDDWAPFHWELANKLLQYEDKRTELAEIAKTTYKEVMGGEFNLRKSGKVTIDPFTVFSLFCRSVAAKNRVKYLTAFAKVFKIKITKKTPIPTTFIGLPEYKMGQTASFCYTASDEDIDTLWKIFEAALKYANNRSAENRKIVYDLFDSAIATNGNGFFKITKGLHWIAPKSFLNWDEMNQWYLFECKSRKIPDDVVQTFSAPRGDKISAEDYFDFADKVETYLKGGTCELKNFQELNYEAIREAIEENKRRKRHGEDDETPVDDDGSGSEEIKESYNRDKFLEQVFLPDDTQYEKLVHLLDAKKNIILQGPPGVGKTYAAKRLAWSILELPYSKDEDKCDDSPQIKFVQFHQGYSYEDFVEGYKPVGNNEFQLQNGIFRDFCDVARRKEKEYIDNPDAKENKFFLIIDEINRGNTSKIFGELLMLIEKDHRGETAKLAYSKEDPEHPFYVPKNLFIIGMMNTADRSLAMIDYALRRRFAFFEMAPAFNSKRFLEYYKGVDNNEPLLTFENGKKDSDLLNGLIDWVKKLNDTIIVKDRSLGDGFRIGHSYFCNWDKCTLERMKNVVECDIVPTLEEYWFDNKEKKVGEALNGLPPELIPTKYSPSNT